MFISWFSYEFFWCSASLWRNKYSKLGLYLYCNLLSNNSNITVKSTSSTRSVCVFCDITMMNTQIWWLFLFLELLILDELIIWMIIYTVAQILRLLSNDEPPCSILTKPLSLIIFKTETFRIGQFKKWGKGTFNINIWLQILILFYFFDVTDEEIEINLCQFCQGFVLKNAKELLVHSKTCKYASRPDRSYNFVCYCCPYHTYKSDHMRDHIMRHTGERPFQCDKCDFKSSRKNSVNIHMRVKHYLTSWNKLLSKTTWKHFKKTFIQIFSFIRLVILEVQWWVSKSISGFGIMSRIFFV